MFSSRMDELLENIKWFQQSNAPHSTEISAWDHLLFANNSAMFELTYAEKTRILSKTSEAIKSSFSKHRNSFGRTLLVRHRSTHASDMVS